MKQLTIAIPAYNAEKYIEKCLQSVVGLDNRLEILVINDGSTDRTAQIVEEYVRRYPDEVRMISKDNGGHGSGINVAVQNAAGRYLKVVDADDWVVSENVGPLLERLERSLADIVITGFYTVDASTGKIRGLSPPRKFAGKTVTLEEMMTAFHEIAPCCSFHGVIYRSQMLRDSGIKFLEGVFYEDQEYATVPFAYAESILIMPFHFYEYLIGRQGQSISSAAQVKNLSHVEKVAMRILEERASLGPMSEALDQYFLQKLSVVVVSYYTIALVKEPDRKKGRDDARRFDEIIKEAEPLLLNMTERKRRTLWMMNRLHVPEKIYHWLHETSFYEQIKRLWENKLRG